MAESLKRLNVNLPRDAYEELKGLADKSHRSMTEVVRTALGLVKIAMEEEEKKNSLAIINRNDEVVKEIVLVR